MPKHVMKIQITTDIAVERDGDGFHAHCPAFSAVHAWAPTEKEAIEGARDGVEATVISLLKHNEPIPCCTVLEEDLVPDEAVAPRIFRQNIPISIPYLP